MSSESVNSLAEWYPSDVVGESSTPVEETQRANPNQYFASINAVQHDTQRKILVALVQNDGRLTYKRLKPYMNVGTRSTRKHVKKLERNNLLNRVNAQTMLIEYADTDAEVLVKHALGVWFNQF